MKKNKFTKIFLYTVISLVMAGVIFLALSYFGKGEETRKVDFSEKDKKQEQVDKKENEESNTRENKQDSEAKKTETVEKKEQRTETKTQNKEVVRGNTQSNPVTENYEGKKLSESEGVGTTGKVFKSQKEALDFGKKEIKRLTDEDKKKRQFSISKVTAEDGSLVGWTVDIFEDNNVEKIVSNPSKTNEEEKAKE